MNKNRKLALILAVFIVMVSFFSCGVMSNAAEFDYENENTLPKNDKIMACLPEDYVYDSFGTGFSFHDDDGNTLDFIVTENKFAPKGITSLTEDQVQEIFIHFYICEGEFERDYDPGASFSSTKTVKINGVSAYELKGTYDFEANFIKYPFCTYVLATVEDIFIITYEDMEEYLTDLEDIEYTMSSLVVNGTFFKGDKPENTYNFEGLPSYEDAVILAEEEYFVDIDNLDAEVAGIVIVVWVAFFIVPTLIVVIIAVLLIVRYSKNKKKLSQYERAYGRISGCNVVTQNYRGNSYYPPQQNFNTAYGTNQGYSQTPQTPQTPSYVINTMNNNNPQQTVTQNQNTQQIDRNTPYTDTEQFQNNNNNNF